jgi:hypothetical protein
MFDVEGRSPEHGFQAFPDYLGDFWCGVYLFAENTGNKIFDVEDIVQATLDFEHPTSGNGILSNQRLGPSDDTLDGYVVRFQILRSSGSPIPEPAFWALSCISVLALLTCRDRS